MVGLIGALIFKNRREIIPGSMLLLIGSGALGSRTECAAKRLETRKRDGCSQLIQIAIL
jgi:hypothetical protein